MIKVAKFGGSSLADAEQFKKVKNIIENDENRRIVVVSAAGKRFKEDNKITDLLYLCYAHIKYSVSYESMFSIIENRYLEIRDELGLKCNLESEFRIIKSRMKKGMNRDYLVSRGEYLAGMLMAEYLGYDFIDAENVIFFDYNGKACGVDPFDAGHFDMWCGENFMEAHSIEEVMQEPFFEGKALQDIIDQIENVEGM